jgi:hypothetical protein
LKLHATGTIAPSERRSTRGTPRRPIRTSARISLRSSRQLRKAERDPSAVVTVESAADVFDADAKGSSAPRRCASFVNCAASA